MSDTAERVNPLLKVFEARIRKKVSSKKEKIHTAPVEGSKSLPKMQTRVFSVKGKVESEQGAASEGDYVVEVRILARCHSDNSQDPLAVGFQRRLDDEVKRRLNAIAEQYPQTS